MSLFFAEVKLTAIGADKNSRIKEMRMARPDPTDPEGKRRIYPELTPYQIARMYEVGVRSERVGRGEPDPESPNNYAKFELVISTNPPPVDNPEALAAAMALQDELTQQ